MSDGVTGRDISGNTNSRSESTSSNDKRTETLNSDRKTLERLAGRRNGNHDDDLAKAIAAAPEPKSTNQSDAIHKDVAFKLPNASRTDSTKQINEFLGNLNSREQQLDTEIELNGATTEVLTRLGNAVAKNDAQEIQKGRDDLSRLQAARQKLGNDELDNKTESVEPERNDDRKKAESADLPELPPLKFDREEINPDDLKTKEDFDRAAETLAAEARDLADQKAAVNDSRAQAEEFLDKTEKALPPDEGRIRSAERAETKVVEVSDNLGQETRERKEPAHNVVGQAVRDLAS